MSRLISRSLWTKALYIFREPQSSRKYPDRPTFTEFAEFLISGGLDSNPHVMPFIDFCSLCNRDYKVIAKMETVEEDTE